MVNLITYSVMIIIGMLILGNIFHDLRIEPNYSRFDTQSENTRKQIIPYASIIALVTSLAFFLLLNYLLRDDFISFIEAIENDIETDDNLKRVLLVVSVILAGMFIARQYLKGLGRFSDNNAQIGNHIDRESRGFITLYLSIAFFALYFTQRMSIDAEVANKSENVVQIIPISFIIGVGIYILMKITIGSIFKRVWKTLIDYFL